MAGVTSHVAGSTPQHDGRARWRALAAFALVAWFPFAVALLPVVGGLIGTTGDGTAIDIIRWAIVALLYFTPFLIGAFLGWRAVRAHSGGGVALAAWVGLVGNIVVILVSLMFAAGEVVNPH